MKQNSNAVKLIKILFFTGFFIMQLANSVYGQWNKKGVEGGTVNCFAKKGSDLFVGTMGGVYKSTDNGVSWTFSSYGITVLDIKCMLVTDSKIFAGGVGGIYLSTDDGVNWDLVGLGNKLVYTIIEVHNRLYAGCAGIYGGGIHKSTNGGSSWTYVALENFAIRSMTLAGENIIAGVLGDYGLYISSDYGNTWTPITAFYSSNVAGLSVSGTDVFAACSQGVIRSTDNGISWNNSSNGLLNYETQTISTNSGNLYTGTYGRGLFYSSDNGTNWIAVNTGNSNLYITGLFADDGKVFAGTFGGGVYTSSNNGTNWVKSNDGLSAQAIVALEISGSYIFAATPNGVYVSSDNGETWTESNNGLTNIFGNVRNVFSLAVSGSTVYAGTQIGGAYKSTDNGTSWIAINNGLYMYDTQDVESLAASGQTLFAGTYGWGIFRSTDGGNNWVQTITGLPHQVVESIVFMGTDVYCSTWNGVAKSTNNGNSWILANNGISGGGGPLTVSGTTIYTGTASGLYKSVDGAQNWVAVNNGLTDLNIISLASNGSTVVAGTNSGVFITYDAGEKWTLLNDGFETLAPKIHSLMFDGTNLFAGSLYQSIWKRSDIQVSIEEYPSNKINNFNLTQNYPNPFNPSTTISYSLSTTSMVQLKIFNLLGQEIATLVNEEKPSGNYQVDFDASNLPSGVYFYKIQAGDFVESKKMILLK